MDGAEAVIAVDIVQFHEAWKRLPLEAWAAKPMISESLTGSHKDSAEAFTGFPVTINS